VIDGDTIDVGNVTVRFTLVDTAERGEAMYDEAKLFTSLRCAVGSNVLIDEDDGQTSGSFGRMIAKVYCGDRAINEELLESGNAIILVQHCGESEFANEQWAKNYGC
jgi:endonuclease YncB( thermonuclease family)